MNSILLIPIFLPTLAGLLSLLLPKRVKMIHEILALVASSLSLAVSLFIFTRQGLRFTVDWFSIGTQFTVQFDLLAGAFGSFILLGAALLIVPVAYVLVVGWQERYGARRAAKKAAKEASWALLYGEETPEIPEGAAAPASD